MCNTLLHVQHIDNVSKDQSYDFTTSKTSAFLYITHLLCTTESTTSNPVCCTCSVMPFISYCYRRLSCYGSWPSLTLPIKVFSQQKKEREKGILAFCRDVLGLTFLGIDQILDIQNTHLNRNSAEG